MLWLIDELLVVHDNDVMGYFGVYCTVSVVSLQLVSRCRSLLDYVCC
jgi:hypothetical protein